MSSILAIATISIRSAVRSRVVLILLALMIGTLITLPLSIESDGTAEGYIRILVTYTLGGVSILLSIATLWAGCAAVSDEVTTKQIHMVMSKPVSSLQVWAGKWVGLVGLNLVLLAIAGAILLGLLQFNLGRGPFTDADRARVEEQILAAHVATGPTLPDVESDVEVEYEKLVQQQGGSLRLTPAQARKQLKTAILAQRLSAAPGADLDFTFTLPQSFDREHPLYLEYRLATSALAPLSIPHRWRVGQRGQDWRIVIEQTIVSGRRHRVQLPASTVDADGTLSLSFQHSYDGPVKVVFSPDDGVAVLNYYSSFVPNLGRALLLILFQLALLAAIGVTGGALFSLPVAAFASLFTILLLVSAPYIRSVTEQASYFSTEPGSAVGAQVADFVILNAFRVMHAAVAPLQSVHPLDKVGTGAAIPWGVVGTGFLIRVLLYCGVCAGVGSWLFSRRELGATS